MEKLQNTINNELKDLSESIGIDIKDLKDTINKHESNITLLKESAERELNNLNERIHEVNSTVNGLNRWSVLINNKLENEYVQLSTFLDKTKSQDKIADYLMWAVITEAFVILGLIFYLCLTKVI
ncbi:MAG: hypothetical protein JTJ21_05780 [Holdemanella sp.]|nr:hypothetical protein [Holdemanella sp.]